MRGKEGRTVPIWDMTNARSHTRCMLVNVVSVSYMIHERISIYFLREQGRLCSHHKSGQVRITDEA